MNLAELRNRLAGERRALMLPVELETRQVDDTTTRTLKGHAAVFDRLSEDLGGFKERIKRGAFRKVLDEDQDVRLLINHRGLPLARTKNDTLELREDPKGLRMFAELANTRDAEDLYELVQRRDLDQMSFGFTVAEDEWLERDGMIIRTIISLDRLFDVSPVTFPAYPQTDVQVQRDGGVYIVRTAFGGEDPFTLNERDRAELISELREADDSGATGGAEDRDDDPPADSGDTPEPEADTDTDAPDDGDTARSLVAAARFRNARHVLAQRELGL